LAPSLFVPFWLPFTLYSGKLMSYSYYILLVRFWMITCTICGPVFQAAAQGEVEKLKGIGLHQVQLIGSHNSYKPGIEPALYNIIYRMDSARAAALQYGHIPLKEQLNMGLRNLELDVVHDPVGGRYNKPMGLEWLQLSAVVAEPYDTAGDLNKPGLKVLHIPDVDFRSEHLLFTDCLKELLHWSEQNPGHLPVFVTINAKDGSEKGLTPLLPFGPSALDSIDLEIRQVFSSEKLITPDFIRGTYSSLAERILKTGWPAVEKLAGRFLFVLDETGQKRTDYKQGHPALKERVMFVNEPHGNTDAAVMIINDPVKEGASIKAMVSKGYLVRTRSDANTVEARLNNYNRFRAAMESGAQVITTDYYLPSKFFHSTYKVVFPGGGFVRRNPVTLK
jgi:Phosphoinositide phospholipase C, Ca2+-dependent